MRALGLIVTAALVLLLVALPPEAAGVGRPTCRDGVLALRFCKRCPTQPVCDADQACDGVCTFVFPLCGPEVLDCPVAPQTLTAPLRRPRKVVLNAIPRPEVG